MVLALEAARRVLQARNEHHAIADLLADINFFIGFICYPSASTAGAQRDWNPQGRDLAIVARWTVVGVVRPDCGSLHVFHERDVWWAWRRWPDGDALRPLGRDRIVVVHCVHTLRAGDDGNLSGWYPAAGCVPPRSTRFESSYARALRRIGVRPPRLRVVISPQYALLLYRNRLQLQELRLTEMTIEANYAQAKLEAEGAGTRLERAEMMAAAEIARDASVAEFKKQRATLPTTLRKLTAGCAMGIARTRRWCRSGAPEFT